MRGRSLLTFVAFVGITTACEDDDVVARYSATMTGANENPTNTSPATGTFTATLDEDNILTYSLSFQGLESNSNNAHIHGPGAAAGPNNVPPAVNAGILIFFNDPAAGRVLTFGSTSGSATGTIDLNLPATATVSGDSLLVLLNNGNAYVNIHTTGRPAGEIRGNITRQ